MKYAHTIRVRVICSAQERALYKELLKGMLGEDESYVEDEDFQVSETEAHDLENEPIYVLNVEFEKTRNTNKFLRELTKRLGSEQNETVTSQKNRLDEDCNVYVRLDKERFEDGEYVLTDGGDCVHITISVAAYPKNEDTAWGVVEEVFGDEVLVRSHS